MSARAFCPVCGRTLTVRADDRLPKHWSSPRQQLAGATRCLGSTKPTRHWPTSDDGVRYQRPRRI
jgi:hypothetical protein